MDYGERAVLRRKSRDLKRELKEMKRQLLGAGCEKGSVGQYLKELQDALELGALEREAYEAAGAHLEQAREMISRLLECMEESTAGEVENSLRILTEHLDGVYHDCLIREDDLDFKSTMGSLKQMIRLQANGYSNGGADSRPGSSSLAAGADAKAGKGKKVSQVSAAALQGAAQAGMSDIMLRSELENIKAVLDDAAGWSAPDFFALAYYFLHEAKDSLRDMENQQRNAHVAAYLKVHFTDVLLREWERAHMEAKLAELIHKYVYDTVCE